MKARETEEALLAEINITPFTDVLLVLLIIFMILAALTVPPGFERTLQQPAAPAHRLQILHSTPVTITRRGGIYVNGVPTAVPALYKSMARLHAANARTRIALYADAHAPYGLVIRVLDAAKAAGITDVSFVTQ